MQIKKMQASTTKMSLAKKLTFSFAGLSAATIIGSAGIAAAQSGQTSMPSPTSKADCAHWQDFTQPKFKNHGQCVSWVEHNVLGHGHGYGGNVSNTTNVSTNVSTNVKGNKNTVETIISYVF